MADKAKKGREKHSKRSKTSHKEKKGHKEKKHTSGKKRAREPSRDAKPDRRRRDSSSSSSSSASSDADGRRRAAERAPPPAGARAAAVFVLTELLRARPEGAPELAGLFELVDSGEAVVIGGIADGFVRTALEALFTAARLGRTGGGASAAEAGVEDEDEEAGFVAAPGVALPLGPLLVELAAELRISLVPPLTPTTPAAGEDEAAWAEGAGADERENPPSPSAQPPPQPQPPQPRVLGPARPPAALLAAAAADGAADGADDEARDAARVAEALAAAAAEAARRRPSPPSSPDFGPVPPRAAGADDADGGGGAVGAGGARSAPAAVPWWRRTAEEAAALRPTVSDEPVREEWMTALPTGRAGPNFAPDLARTFTRAGISAIGDTSEWTDTPADKARKAKARERERERIAAAARAAAQAGCTGVLTGMAAPRAAAAPTAPAAPALPAPAPSGGRSVSLVAMHLQAIGRGPAAPAAKGAARAAKAAAAADKAPLGWDPEAAPWRPFDRDKDLDARRADPNGLKRALNDHVMGTLSSRFGTKGKTESSFM